MACLALVLSVSLGLVRGTTWNLAKGFNENSMINPTAFVRAGSAAAYRFSWRAGLKPGGLYYIFIPRKQIWSNFTNFTTVERESGNLDSLDNDACVKAMQVPCCSLATRDTPFITCDTGNEESGSTST